MGRHRQGDQGKAEELLQRAKTTIERALPQQADEPVDVAVPDWIGIEALRREAEGLIDVPQNVTNEPEHSASDGLKND